MLEKDDLAPDIDQISSLLWSDRGKRKALCNLIGGYQAPRGEGERQHRFFNSMKRRSNAQEYTCDVL